MFGVTHTLAGRLLGNKWKLPPQITVVVAAHHVPPSERVDYPRDINRTIDLLTLVDHVVHRVHAGGGDRAGATSAVERLLEEPENGPMLDAVGVGARAAVDAIQPALAAVERQRKLLGIKTSMLA
jgi:hypothetical protein